MATLVLVATLQPSTEFTCTVPAGLASSEGNTLWQDHAWTFRTPRVALSAEHCQGFHGEASEGLLKAMRVSFTQAVQIESVRECARAYVSVRSSDDLTNYSDQVEHAAGTAVLQECQENEQEVRSPGR